LLVYNLAKMEAAFSCGYSLTGDYIKCSKHLNNLLVYYKMLIYGRYKLEFFNKFSIHDIESDLPGAATLLNKYDNNVLPSKISLWFIDEIIRIAENYNIEFGYSNEMLFEVYKKALDIAQIANDSKKETFYKTKMADISSIHYEY
ncbi:MAG: hypothetical protein FWD23_17455, partial [Oscillospiraceae bacterium]|nr:hypothetical protein [Oscillospiraceae bacterium]